LFGVTIILRILFDISSFTFVCTAHTQSQPVQARELVVVQLEQFQLIQTIDAPNFSKEVGPQHELLELRVDQGLQVVPHAGDLLSGRPHNHQFQFGWIDQVDDILRAPNDAGSGRQGRVVFGRIFRIDSGEDSLLFLRRRTQPRPVQGQRHRRRRRLVLLGGSFFLSVRRR
jgi:hypothetical protein